MSKVPPYLAEVLDGGVQTTVQDLGRIGYRASGVPAGGAMDPFALRAANVLVGNSEDAAGLEVLLGGLRLRFPRELVLSVAGADLDGRLNGEPLELWARTSVPAGSDLCFGRRCSGARAYLAFAGGIATEQVLGSRSTYLPGGWGGLDGRPLRAGDVLPLGARPQLDSANTAWLPPERRPPYTPFPTLRCVVGPHHDRFQPEALAALWSTEYALTAAADRMGYRLEGAPLYPLAGGTLASLGVLPGVVQAPPDGRPIMLMADAQTTGGYPVIAVVIGVDLPLAAQLLPGDRVRFQPVSAANAYTTARERRRDLDWLREADEIAGVPI